MVVSLSNASKRNNYIETGEKMIENFKKNLATIVQGLMFGLGFCVAGWVLYFALQPKPHDTYVDRNDAVTSQPSVAKSNPFIFRDVVEIKRNGRSYFIGAVKNNGASATRSISIEVNLFLKDKFVDQYSSYVSGDLAPGEERYFKIACGCKDELPAEHDSYKIAVIGGF